MPVRTVDADDAKVLSHGGPLSPIGDPGPYGVPGPDGAALAVIRESDGRARPEVVLAPPKSPPWRGIDRLRCRHDRRPACLARRERCSPAWRSLVAAIAPGVAIALPLQGLLTASAGVAVLDGSYVTKPGWQQYAALPYWIVAWTRFGQRRDADRPGFADRRPGPRRFRAPRSGTPPGLGAGGARRADPFNRAAVLVAVPIAGVLGPFGIVAMFLAAFIPASTILALPFVALDGEQTAPAIARAWELSAGKRWRAFGSPPLGRPAAAVQWLADRSPAGGRAPCGRFCRRRPGRGDRSPHQLPGNGAHPLAARQDTTAEHGFLAALPAPTGGGSAPRCRSARFWPLAL